MDRMPEHALFLANMHGADMPATVQELLEERTPPGPFSASAAHVQPPKVCLARPAATWPRCTGETKPCHLRPSQNMVACNSIVAVHVMLFFWFILVADKDGLSILTSHLSAILYGRNALDQQREAPLVLMPKVARISAPRNLRPIALMKIIHKLYMSLLIRRLQTTWSSLGFQLGAYPGSQVLDPLFMACNRLQREALQQTESAWLSAWHNLEEAQMRPCLARLLTEEVASPGLCMEYHGKRTVFRPCKEVLQGGTHSSQVFSALINCVLTRLRAKRVSTHPTAVYAWAYVDDCIFVFRSLEDANYSGNALDP